LNKGLVSYFKKNGIITLKNHVDVNHVLIAKQIEEVNKKHEKFNGDKQPTKKRPIVSVNAIFNFLGPRSFQKE
jgi:hypothetical protein